MLVENKPNDISTESIDLIVSDVESEAEQSDGNKTDTSAVEKDNSTPSSDSMQSATESDESEESSLNYTSQSSSSATQEQKPEKKIVAWGDSFTRGMGMADNENYPAYLKGLVGDGYDVINQGISGENSYTIAARQGAVEVFTAEDIVFEAGQRTVKLGNAANNGLVSADGVSLNLNRYGYVFDTSSADNGIYIDGVRYQLTSPDGDFYLSRSDTTQALAIPKGTKAVFASSENSEGSYCEIFYVGANDNLAETEESKRLLIERYQKMIKRHGNDCYLVIIPHWTRYFDDALTETFGDKAVNLCLAENIYRIMAEQGFKPTKDDMEMIGSGKLPRTYRYKNLLSENHLSKYGYEYMATLLYERGVQLGYW